MENNTNEQTPPSDPDLARLETLAAWLDNRFRIPGTKLRFGLDGVVGLVPYLGDVTGFVVSGFLVRTMIRRGAGPVLMLQMMGNVVFDAVAGVVPVAGDLFDFGYKANRRNVELLKRYYADGRAKPRAGRSLTLLGILFLALFVLFIWGIWAATAWLAGWVWSKF